MLGSVRFGSVRFGFGNGDGVGDGICVAGIVLEDLSRVGHRDRERDSFGTATTSSSFPGQKIRVCLALPLQSDFGFCTMEGHSLMGEELLIPSIHTGDE